MTGQDLKNSILKLAVQGKLVEQREEEGTAESLYQEIQEEKEKLIKKKRLEERILKIYQMMKFLLIYQSLGNG